MAFVFPISRFQWRPSSHPTAISQPFFSSFTSSAFTLPRNTRRRRTLTSIPTSKAQSPYLPPTAAKTSDPATTSSVFLVGCVHGSQVSADDVRSVMTTTEPDAVVLELCPPRFATLRTAIRKTPPNGRVSASLRSRKRRSFSKARETFKGTPQAMLASLLETAYSLQTLSGLDPGIEFAHPIRTMSHGQLICGDAPAPDTVQGLYKAFTSPLESLRLAREALRGIPARLLQRTDGGVNIPFAILSNRARVLEITRLLVPISLIAVSFSFLSNLLADAAAQALEGTAVTSSLSVHTSVTSAATLPAMLVTILPQALFFVYVSTSLLHFMKVLVADRDAIIAKSIEDSAAYYSKKFNRPVTIVAVVGLLHVNGILRALQKAGDVPS